jgi:uncharacterized protein YutE (UPF0331/DUF86 family)
LPTKNSQIIKSFLKENIYRLESSSGGGGSPNLPDYEIHPREFLEYAESELCDLSNNKSIVNCVSNLKRAIDCQIDIFLHAINVQKLFKKRNLGIDRKLGFIEKCGIFSKYSLSRINTIRNKLEHHYQAPKIDDIYVYYDLVSAFISVLEANLCIAGVNSQIEFCITAGPRDGLTTCYDAENAQHKISWNINNEEFEFIATTENLEELAAFIRIHALLLNIDQTFHCKYAISQLEKL